MSDTETPDVNEDSSVADGLFGLIRDVLSEKQEQQETKKAFDDLHEHDSKPSLDEPTVQKISSSELAQTLSDTRIQGYIQANFGIQALKLVQQLVPLLLNAI